jgi:hypothetical protein
MGDGDPRERHGWLEIVGEAEEPHLVHCPRKERDMPLKECLGCKRYHSLAIDPTGKHVYLDCDWVGADDVLAPPPEEPREEEG